MSRWKSLMLSLLCIGVGLALLVGNLHILRVEDGWTWGWKAEMGLSRTLVDTRDWEPVDFFQNSDLTGILMQRGYRDLIPRPSPPVPGERRLEEPPGEGNLLRPDTDPR